MQKIAVMKISMQHTKKSGVWPEQQKVFGSITVIETFSPIFHLIRSKMKICVNVFALLVHDFILAQFDKTLVVLYNCHWIFLMDAEIFKKLFKIQCFLHCCRHTLIFCFWWPKNTVACFLTPLLSGALSMKKYPVVIVLLLIFCCWNHKTRLRDVHWAWKNTPSLSLVFCCWHHQTSMHPLASFVLLSFKLLNFEDILGFVFRIAILDW